MTVAGCSYHMLEVIGKGGFGTVRRAIDYGKHPPLLSFPGRSVYTYSMIMLSGCHPLEVHEYGMPWWCCPCCRQPRAGAAR